MSAYPELTLINFQGTCPQHSLLGDVAPIAEWTVYLEPLLAGYETKGE
ncbi:MAG: hypothetical protein AAGG51_01370 [Cyanobacteria bacterium P01_G01_bin.54]